MVSKPGSASEHQNHWVKINPHISRLESRSPKWECLGTKPENQFYRQDHRLFLMHPALCCSVVQAMEAIALFYDFRFYPASVPEWPIGHIPSRKDPIFRWFQPALSCQETAEGFCNILPCKARKGIDTFFLSRTSMLWTGCSLGVLGYSFLKVTFFLRYLQWQR